MKKIRVAWDDLKPGDLIHVKGSTNVYQSSPALIGRIALKSIPPNASHTHA